MSEFEKPAKAEVERRFLVDLANVPLADLGTPVESVIDQGYAIIGARGSEQRARLILDTATGETSYTTTIKSGSGLVRGEPVNEALIPEDLFDGLWTMAGNRTLRKRRWALPFEAHELAIDTFLRRHYGLVMTEIEFAGESTEEKEDAAASFQPFPWLGPEVTQDPSYRNRALATDFTRYPILGDRAFKSIDLFNGGTTD